jgi:hypothetical protein
MWEPRRLAIVPCLYQITNLLNGKYYIGVHRCGSTCRFGCRYMGSGQALKAAIKKYGREHFRKDILADNLAEQLAYQLENAVVTAAFITQSNTYNMTVGGGVPPRSSNKGRRMPSMLGNKNALGYRWTEARHAHMRDVARNRSAATRQKVSEKAKQRWTDPKFRDTLLTRSYNQWTHKSKETRRKQSESMKRRWAQVHAARAITMPLSK